ncbi:hypothetical protein FQZ97_1244170 [compost metagenome]
MPEHIRYPGFKERDPVTEALPLFYSIVTGAVNNVDLFDITTVINAVGVHSFECHRAHEFYL